MKIKTNDSETNHIVDTIERSMAWYDRHFTQGRAQTTQ